MEYRRVKDQESYDAPSQKDIESPGERSLSSTSATSSLSTAAGVSKGKNSWKLKSVVTLALTLLTSSQAILIVWSKRAGKYEYSVTAANFSVEALKCLLSLIALYRTWNSQGVTEDNRLSTSFDEVKVYPIPAILYMVKNLMQVMALLSGFAGVYTEAIIKKRPSRNINVQNFWLYIFGMLFNLVAICVQDFDAVMNNGIAVSMVMKYADNIVKVYSTSVAMLLTAVVSVFLFGFHLSLAFFLGSTWYSILQRAENMVNAIKGLFISCDVPMAQFIVNLNASMPASEKFIVHMLDPTHMFVQPHVVEMIRSKISEFRDQNSYEKPA
uniref:Uncharacterized protein n=1 Tax=Leersia perrieri TaxID=77586 RepID=A0A0D9X0N0_9ORYZ